VTIFVAAFGGIPTIVLGIGAAIVIPSIIPIEEANAEEMAAITGFGNRVRAVEREHANGAAEAGIHAKAHHI